MTGTCMQATREAPKERMIVGLVGTQVTSSPGPSNSKFPPPKFSLSNLNQLILPLLDDTSPK